MKSSTKQFWSAIGVEFSLILLSAILFALAFPNPFYRWGFPLFAWIAYFPLIILVHKISFPKAFLYGALFGIISNLFFNYWMAGFDPMAAVVVPLIYAWCFLFLLPALKAADLFFPKYGYLLQATIWVAFEYLRTTGVLAYPYGVIGYSQHNFISLIQISELTGVAGVTLLVIFPSIIIGNAFKDGISIFKSTFKKWITPSALWLLLVIGSIIFGFISQVDYSKTPKVKTALIQHNINSWRQGIDVYEEAVDKLIDLSEEAIKEDPDLIIWSETAVVPSINYYMKNRGDRRRVNLAKNILSFMEDSKIPFIIGNNELIYKSGESLNYNGVFLYDEGREMGRYYKNHLVPFTEYYPFGDRFQFLQDYIATLNVSYFAKGEDFNLIEYEKYKIGPLVCFEDCFGYISREFTKKGANILINLTNDSWSDQFACNIQHMQIGTFRAIENRRTLLRSTNGGFTTAIDPNGVRLGELEPFTSNYLLKEIPLYEERTTLFTLWGHWFDYLAIITSLFGLLYGLTKYIYKRRVK